MATWPEHWPDPQPEPALLDAERDRVVGRLRTEVTEGRISLDRFSDLVGEVFAARTRSDLEPVHRALGDAEPPAGQEPERRASRVRRGGQWAIAIFGQSTRGGRYRLEDNTTAAAVFGDCTIDLTHAHIDGDEVTINAIAAFGNVTVIVPHGIDVDVQGAAIFGNRRYDVRGPAVDGAPVLVIRAFACFGDIRVRSPKASRR